MLRHWGIMGIAHKSREIPSVLGGFSGATKSPADLAGAASTQKAQEDRPSACDYYDDHTPPVQRGYFRQNRMGLDRTIVNFPTG